MLVLLSKPTRINAEEPLRLTTAPFGTSSAFSILLVMMLTTEVKPGLNVRIRIKDFDSHIEFHHTAVVTAGCMRSN